MGIGKWRASTGAAIAAVLLCFGSMGTAVAEELPSDGAAVTDDTAISADQTTDVNDRQGWEDDADQPLSVDAPSVCDQPSTWYSITSNKSYQIPSWWNGTKFKDGPGGTMAVSVTKSGTISAEIAGSIEFSTNAIIAKAKTQVSAKVGASVTIATGHNYTHDISHNKYGHLQYGAWGFKLTWKKYRSAGVCGAVEIGHGTATVPTSETGWRYWETSS
ncbi:hypothetical protein [Streptomyces prunicolor]|uniref:hypothetical protein n=1 Tax=Streptomyces prunicolor TaxID=67348 RepID=UPI001319D71C|nr:hypothetical protein [Streptomyces prunicolor]